MSSKKIEAYEFGRFRVDATERCLLREGRLVPLTAKVFDILLLLVKNSGRLVPKDELMNEIWPDIAVEDNNLTVNISALRKALGQGGDDPVYIETVPRRGYRFNADVRRVVEEEEDDDEDEGGPSSWRGRASSAGVGALGVRRQQQVANSLAVLPLANASADPNLEYLSDGVTESIINSLSRLPQLRVMSRSTTFRFRGPEVDAQAVGRELKVRAVLVGRVRRVSGRIIISTELVDVADGAQIWGEQYNSKASDILRVQTEIAEDVSEKLRLKLTADERARLAKHSTENIEAYHLYLKGRYFWNKFFVKWVKKGLEYFQQAIDVDPNYALAYAGIADSYYRLSSTHLNPEEACPKAKAAAVKALELDPDLAEAHASLGLVKMYYDHDLAGAEFNYRRAIEINPNVSLAHQRYGSYLMYIKRFDEGMEEFKLAKELDPLSLQMNVNMGTVLLLARRYDEALPHYQKALDIDPSYYPARYCVASTMALKGDYAEAIEGFRKVCQSEDDNDMAYGYLGRVYALTGDRDNAEDMLAELHARAARKYVSRYSMALIHEALGEKERAIEQLEMATEAKDDWIVLINVAPEFDRLRDSPRFQNLLRRVGFDG